MSFRLAATRSVKVHLQPPHCRPRPHSLAAFQQSKLNIKRQRYIVYFIAMAPFNCTTSGPHVPGITETNIFKTRVESLIQFPNPYVCICIIHDSSRRQGMIQLPHQWQSLYSTSSPSISPLKWSEWRPQATQPYSSISSFTRRLELLLVQKPAPV